MYLQSQQKQISGREDSAVRRGLRIVKPACQLRCWPFKAERGKHGAIKLGLGVGDTLGIARGEHRVGRALGCRPLELGLVGREVGEHNTDILVEIDVPTLGRHEAQMNRILQSTAAGRRGRGHVCALAQERVRAWGHRLEIVLDDKDLDARLLRVADDDLDQASGGHTIHAGVFLVADCLAQVDDTDIGSRRLLAREGVVHRAQRHAQLAGGRADARRANLQDEAAHGGRSRRRQPAIEQRLLEGAKHLRGRCAGRAERPRETSVAPSIATRARAREDGRRLQENTSVIHGAQGGRGRRDAAIGKRRLAAGRQARARAGDRDRGRIESSAWRNRTPRRGAIEDRKGRKGTRLGYNRNGEGRMRGHRKSLQAACGGLDLGDLREELCDRCIQAFHVDIEHEWPQCDRKCRLPRKGMLAETPACLRRADGHTHARKLFRVTFAPPSMEARVTQHRLDDELDVALGRGSPLHRREKPALHKSLQRMFQINIQDNRPCCLPKLLHTVELLLGTGRLRNARQSILGDHRTERLHECESVRIRPKAPHRHLATHA
eukprot:m.30803 g.30803  ORF g.30803 m.30803 type:complete len:549 (-) comp4815_c0_seq1:79-1725(-)